MAKNLGKIYPDYLDCEILSEEMIYLYKLVVEQDEGEKILMPSAIKCL